MPSDFSKAKSGLPSSRFYTRLITRSTKFNSSNGTRKAKRNFIFVLNMNKIPRKNTILIQVKRLTGEVIYQKKTILSKLKLKRLKLMIIKIIDTKNNSNTSITFVNNLGEEITQDMIQDKNTRSFEPRVRSH